MLHSFKTLGSRPAKKRGDHGILVDPRGRPGPRKVECAESDCWEFTALACKLCDAKGAYRGPSDTARVFMTFGEVTLSHEA